MHPLQKEQRARPKEKIAAVYVHYHVHLGNARSVACVKTHAVKLADDENPPV